MDEATLRACIKNLGNRLASLHHWSDLWTALVIVGVAFEVIVLIVVYLAERHDFRQGFIHAPEKPSLRLLVFEMLGVVLVTGGIMGELVVGMRVQHAEEDLAHDNEELVDLVESNALDRATRLRTDLNRSITDGKAIAKKLENEQQEASDVEAQLRADMEDTELVLAAKASGHTLWPSLLKSLSSMRPANARISCVATCDPLTAEFMLRLSAVLTRFHWQVSAGPSGINAIGSGVVIRNRWLSYPVQWGQRMPLGASIELDPSFVAQDIEYRARMDRKDAWRLSTLALALRASLEKESYLDENTLEIVIAPGDSK